MSFLIVIGFVLAVMAHIKIYMIQHAMLNLVSSMSQKLTDMETAQQVATKTEVMRVFESINAINARKAKLESDKPVVAHIVPEVQTQIEEVATSVATQATETDTKATLEPKPKTTRKRKEAAQTAQTAQE